MIMPEFLQRLRAIEARWLVLDHGDIRCERGDCPITAVAHAETGEAFSPDLWEEAADALGLDVDLGEAIVDAADLNDWHDTDLRRELLAATVGPPRGGKGSADEHL